MNLSMGEGRASFEVKRRFTQLDVAANSELRGDQQNISR